MRIYDVFYHDEINTPYRYTERGLDRLVMKKRKWERTYPEYIRSLEVEDLPEYILKYAKSDYGITLTLEEARELAMQPMSD